MALGSDLTSFPSHGQWKKKAEATSAAIKGHAEEEFLGLLSLAPPTLTSFPSKTLLLPPIPTSSCAQWGLEHPVLHKKLLGTRGSLPEQPSQELLPEALPSLTQALEYLIYPTASQAL